MILLKVEKSKENQFKKFFFGGKTFLSVPKIENVCVWKKERSKCLRVKNHPFKIRLRIIFTSTCYQHYVLFYQFIKHFYCGSITREKNILCEQKIEKFSSINNVKLSLKLRLIDKKCMQYTFYWSDTQHKIVFHIWERTEKLI